MSYGELLAWIVPLTLLSTLSPMMLVQAAAIRQQHGVRGNLLFLAGIAIVFAVLGVASMGLLGASAENWAEQELASKRVDAVLATLLAGYGSYLVITSLRARRLRGSGLADDGRPGGPAAGHDASPTVSIPKSGLFVFGLLTTATDLTGLPMYISIAQRIGVTAIGWPLKVGTLLTCTAVILSPAWLPMALHHGSGYQHLIDRISRPLAALAHWAALIGSFAGAAALYWHAFS